MKKIYLFLTAMVLVLTACEKDQIGRYDLGSYVYFTQKETASQSFSFSYYPGLTTHSLEFEVNLMGDLLTEDKTFELYIDTEKTTATPDMYELNLHPVFHQGTATDQITVPLKKPNDILKDKEVTLVFGIKENENFQPGFVGQRSITINFNDIASKPLWWDSTVESYLGAYDAYKLDEFIKCTGVNDLTGVDETLIRKYALDFKEYIEENGLDIDIPVY